MASHPASANSSSFDERYRVNLIFFFNSVEQRAIQHAQMSRCVMAESLMPSVIIVVGGGWVGGSTAENPRASFLA